MFIRGSVTVINTIIANSGNGVDCLGLRVNEEDHNLIEDNSCGFSGGSDPKLGPLQDNGGPTYTHALLAGSPALNRGASTLATDQRGTPRPQGSAADIGAFELTYDNSAPVANPQTVTTQVDTTKAITLTGSDVDNDLLTYTIVTVPTSGTVNGTAPNVTYTPNAGFSGSDSFTFRVNDGTDDSAPAIVSVMVEEQEGSNRQPIAVDDAVTITAGTTATISVLTNDLDPDGDALTVTIGQPPQNGSAVVSGDAIVYTPSANFSGVDSLIYTISDGKGATANATITITVQAQVREAPLYLPLIRKE